MWPFSHWTTAARAALMYFSVGALIMIWAGVWYIYLLNNQGAEFAYYWCTGFLVTGLVIVLIGLGLGLFSRSNGVGDPTPVRATPPPLPPAAAPIVVVNPSPNVSATAPAQSSVNGVAVGVAPDGQVVAPPAL